mgnify:FL=1|tara:strand:- start:550 stop:1389 length:840 start_codon:yes stop_codon:yes gene_type:complete
MVDRINIGKITLLSLTDGSAPPVDPTWPFPKVEITKWNNHFDALDHNHKHTSNFGSFIIISNDEKILVDTGLGNHTTEKLNSPPMKLEKNLLRLGIRTEEITKVFFTHLHFDHIGWALDFETKNPFFINAEYLVSSKEWEYWKNCDDPNRLDHINGFNTNFKAIMNFNQLNLIDENQSITKNISTFPTPGHTPGHTSLIISSNQIKGYITGDIFHSVAQFTNPDWSHRADINSEMAIKTRKTFLEKLTGEEIIAAGHLEHNKNIGKLIITKEKKYWKGF